MRDIVRKNCRIHWTTRSSVEILGRIETYKKPITFPVLWIDGKLAMSASPQEVLMMKDAAKGARGDALVGGLGLGLVLEHLKPRCKSVTVVEKLPEVTELYKAYRKPKKPFYDKVIHATIEEILETTLAPKYDFVFVDTWFEGDYEFLPHLNWIEREAKRILRPRGIVRLWHRDDMVEGFVRECRRLFCVKRSIQAADPANIKALIARFPLAGTFTKWLKDHLSATIWEAEEEARKIASKADRFKVPLELVDDLRAVGL